MLVPHRAIDELLVLDEARLRRLLEAGRSLVAHLDLEGVLENLLAVATELTGARHAAIGEPPRGRGVLGVPIVIRGEAWGQLYLTEKHDATVVDCWRMRDWKVAEVMDVDRLHLNPVGHQAIAIAVLDRLGVAHDLEPLAVPILPELPRRAQRQADLEWARAHLVPWVQRRITGRSSGDGVEPKRPGLSPIG